MIRYDFLISRAEKLRERAQRHSSHLEHLAEQERKLRDDIEPERSKAKDEQEFADKFQTELGQGGPICPDCYVFEHGKVRSLTPPDPDAEDQDTYKCESCGYRVSLK